MGRRVQLAALFLATCPSAACDVTWFGGGPRPQSIGSGKGPHDAEYRKQTREVLASWRAACTKMVDPMLAGAFYVATGDRAPWALLLLEVECVLIEQQQAALKKKIPLEIQVVPERYPGFCERIKASMPPEGFHFVRNGDELSFEYFAYEDTESGPKITEVYSRFRILPEMYLDGSCGIPPWEPLDVRSGKIPYPSIPYGTAAMDSGTLKWTSWGYKSLTPLHVYPPTALVDGTPWGTGLE
jgi:hypothetical protein